MDKYYHTTKYEYLNDISENGLVPRVGERSFSVTDDRVAVYLSKGIMPTILMFFGMKGIYETYTGREGNELLNTSQSTIDYYNKKIERRKKSKFEFLRKSVERLEDKKDAFVISKSIVENMQQYNSFEDYWGDGVYLTVSNVPDIQYKDTDVRNCWVQRVVPPEDISVVLLKNKKTGELIDNKRYIINYFMAITPINDLHLEHRKTIGKFDDKYDDMDAMRDFFKYYDEHEKEFEELRNNFELTEMPIKEYIESFSNNKAISL